MRRWKALSGVQRTPAAERKRLQSPMLDQRYAHCQRSVRAGCVGCVGPVASKAVNQVKSRLQALGLLDRAFANVSDDELVAARDALGEDHRDAFDQLIAPDADADTIRDTISRGRLDGTMESAALVLTDACLADCIEALGDDADYPSSDRLREVLPDLIDDHGLGLTQLMLASTVAGEAPAAAIIRDLLKNDDTIKLPPAQPKPISPIVQKTAVDQADRDALKAKRKEMRKRKQEQERVRREQAKKDRGRS